ncbi:tetratricopeptide repeat (TPR)-like superfamily protein [Actinidia rufa]|uniref:Tetratricopeptide repeat (TPR)-like superfamily protein n=1 Tax=Actinidia rufa TaxID=165716 RepID=A0A7J0G2R4_9ERIC|nr:tetratricopeptide repeat (TPR)-like superfamily protein [Actinidia rufa]
MGQTGVPRPWSRGPPRGGEMTAVPSCRNPALRKQNVFYWSDIIVLYCKTGFIENALLGLCETQENGILGNNFVVPNVLKACGALQLIGFGKEVHGKCGVLGDARKVFDKMLERNAVAWNSMTVSYVQNGMSEEALEVANRLMSQ